MADVDCPAEVVASLEGMRVRVDGRDCHLETYDFNENAWKLLKTAKVPLPRYEAENWLEGWNAVDRFTAINLLVLDERARTVSC